jgi:hypothetical protein
MALALPSGAAALAVPANSPRKEKKRKRKDIVAAEGGEAARKDGDGEEDEDDEPAGQVGVDVKQAAKRRRDETL